MKDFGLTERFNLQFRMDAFNLFNHPVLALPGTCIDCSGSGLITNIDGNTTMRALAVRSASELLGSENRSTLSGGSLQAPSILLAIER